MQAKEVLENPPMELLNMFVGMSGWRLGGTMDEVIQVLVARIESTWREVLNLGEGAEHMAGSAQPR